MQEACLIETFINHLVKLRLIKINYEQKIDLITKQLSFEVNSLCNPETVKSMERQLQLVQKGSNDYKLAVNLIKNKLGQRKMNLIRLFKVKPETDFKNLCNHQIYYQGVQSSSISSILTSGCQYKPMNPFDARNPPQYLYSLDSEYSATSWLKQEALGGSSYCTCEGEIRRLCLS